MNFKLDKEQIKGLGKTGLKLGKSIIVEGTKAVAIKAAAKVITTGFEDGFGAIKDIKLDDVIGKKEKKIVKTKTVEVVEVEEVVAE